MLAKVSNPPLPSLIAGPPIVNQWSSSLVRKLIDALSAYATRLNVALPNDGSEPMTGPLQVATYAFAGLPASPTVGMMVYISNSATNTWGAAITTTGSDKVLAWFNGTNWTVVGK